MTCKEKYLKDHPEMDFDRVLRLRCPSNYEYLDDPNGEDRCDGWSCRDCWNREIPDKKESDMIELKSCALCGEKPGEIYSCGGVPTITHTCINEIEMRVKADTKYGVARKWNGFVTVTARMGD